MDAQEVARLDFIAHKARTKYAESRTYDVQRMRNAWVAYHASRPWMGHPDSVGSLILQATRENDRLRAEVERLRSGIEKLSGTIERVGAERPLRAFNIALALRALTREDGEGS